MLYVCAHSAIEGMWMSEDNLQESILLSYHVDAGNLIQVSGSKHHYTPSHLAQSKCFYLVILWPELSVRWLSVPKFSDILKTFFITEKNSYGQTKSWAWRETRINRIIPRTYRAITVSINILEASVANAKTGEKYRKTSHFPWVN